MKILPITNNNNTFHGSLSNKTGNLVLGMGSHFNNSFNGTSIVTQRYALAMRMALVYDNLHTIMERCAHGAELTFEKLNNGIHRFFIQHPESNYKYMVSDILLSERHNKAEDVDKIEDMVNVLSKVNPFELNLKFKLQSKPNALDSSFVPDKSYVNIEDRLVVPDKKELEKMSADEMIVYFSNLGKDKKL